jgi:hypothetical protein
MQKRGQNVKLGTGNVGAKVGLIKESRSAAKVKMGVFILGAFNHLNKNFPTIVF